MDIKDTVAKCEIEREEIICKLQNIVDESNIGETRNRISEYGCTGNLKKVKKKSKDRDHV